MIDEYSLSPLTIVTPHEIKRNASITVFEGKIKDFSVSKKRNYQIGDSYIAFPALVNAHDHLFGNYYPKIGSGPYMCWLPWDYDLKSSPVYTERNKNTPYDIYLMSSYKNLLSGVTTVQDHIPHQINDPYIDRLPIRVMKDYCLAHEVSVYDLKWGEGIDAEYRKAVKKDIPFITHVEEGFDEESMRGIDILADHGALSQHTVVIHGIGLSDRDIERIAKKKVNFVWCPGSNYYMFNRTARLKEIREAGVNVSIGTDSTATGELNILEEMRFAKKVYRNMYGEELADKTLVEMVTVNPVKALRLERKLGSLEPGKLGDILIVTGGVKNPYSALVQAELRNISLVIMEGRPVYGDEKFEPLFRDLGPMSRGPAAKDPLTKGQASKTPAAGANFTRIKIQGKSKIIVGDPAGLVKKLRKIVGFHKELPYLPV
jgi:cytosine/adenosine deaminase-related metal-dependent hydrolase